MSKRLTHIQVMLKNYRERMQEIRNREEIDPLCMNERIELKIEISTGGPADGFKLYLDAATREVMIGCYYFADWGWYEEEWLSSADLDLVAGYFAIV